MNVTLPEKERITKKQLIIYIAIIVICIASVIAAFYVQFYTRTSIGQYLGITSKDSKIGSKTEDEQQTLKSEFNTIFSNSIQNDDGNNDSKKADQSQKLVYTKYEKKEAKLNSFDLEIHIPAININGEVIDNFNKDIENTFATTAVKVLKSENNNVVYNVEYVADIHEDILSLLVKSNLKDGTKPQKTVIKTYNYDLRNNKEISLKEILKIEQLDEIEVQNKINSDIQIEKKRAEDLKSLGYTVHLRNPDNDMYKIENTNNFYFTGDRLYIIYAYGNDDDTSDIDLIIL